MEQETPEVAESKIIQDEYPRPELGSNKAESGRSKIWAPDQTPDRVLRTPSQAEANARRTGASPLIVTPRGLKCSTCGCDQRMLCFKCRKGGYCPHCSVTLLLAPLM